MRKIGLKLSVNVEKIEKARLFKGQKGTYLDMTVFVDLDEQDQYGNNGFIAQSVSKEEREQGVRTEILGNTKVFYGANQTQQTPLAGQQNQPVKSVGADGGGADVLNDSIPF